MSYKHLSILLLVMPFLTSFQAARALNSQPVTFDSVRKLASDLAHQPFVPAPNDIPQSLLKLDYDAYRAINYLHDKAIWTWLNLPFGLEFYHRGYLYQDRVHINLIQDGLTVPADFHPSLFKYDNGRPADLEPGIGFAGFRILYHPDISKGVDEVVSFLGASYFRAVPIGGFYGASVRAVAIDTAAAGSQEEFPAFRKFWIIRPKPNADVLILYALLDSPSITGTYQFQIKPAAETLIDVQQSLFARNKIKALGIAPLTSMFFYGENKNDSNIVPGIRPEIHDSDGLLLNTGSDQWLWRPLQNPKQNLISSFGVDNKFKGFGLLQRDRKKDNYNDPNTSFEKRPSIWVEPVDAWPNGKVVLLELHSKGEGMDNIVAQYVPDSPLEPAGELNLKYRLIFYSHEKTLHKLAHVVRTISKLLSNGSKSYEIDFDAKQLPTTATLFNPKPLVTADGADVADINLFKKNDIYRLSFVVSAREYSNPIELRASLVIEEVTVSEIWSDQWKL